MMKTISAFLLLFVSLNGCTQNDHKMINEVPKDNLNTIINPNKDVDAAVFGAGCFWCVEAVFQRLEGVDTVYSGYAGGTVKNPTYREICTGRTGHAEVIKIEYRPSIISYAELLEVFWLSHYPTQLNRQGNDVGTQYRSSIFPQNNYQTEVAQKSKDLLINSNIYKNEIVTTIEENAPFYVAENYHQNYFNENENQPYCSIVINPKIDKLKKLFSDKLKPRYR